MPDTPKKEPVVESFDEVMENGSYEEESEDDFFDSLDSDIDSYYGKLRKN